MLKALFGAPLFASFITSFFIMLFAHISSPENSNFLGVLVATLITGLVGLGLSYPLMILYGLVIIYLVEFIRPKKVYAYGVYVLCGTFSPMLHQIIKNDFSFYDLDISTLILLCFGGFVAGTTASLIMMISRNDW